VEELLPFALVAELLDSSAQLRDERPYVWLLGISHDHRTSTVNATVLASREVDRLDEAAKRGNKNIRNGL
jgi:hypothetical protein